MGNFAPVPTAVPPGARPVPLGNKGWSSTGHAPGRHVPRAPVRHGPSQPLGRCAELPELAPHRHSRGQTREPRCQHRRQPRPPHLREHGPVDGVQLFEYLLLEEVGQFLEQAEQQHTLSLSHEHPPLRDDAPRDDAQRDVRIRGRRRREWASRRRRAVSILRLLASRLLEQRVGRRRLRLRERGVKCRVKVGVVSPALHDSGS